MTEMPEKPWKPCPPRRGSSLLRSFSPFAASSSCSAGLGQGTRPCHQDTGGESLSSGIISVVPVDISGHSLARLKRSHVKVVPEDSPRGSGEFPNGKYSTWKNVSVSDFYDNHEYGFTLKPSNDLREKTPSRDRWMVRTGVDFDPYPVMDDFRGHTQKSENFQGKKKQSSSFLLCSSRKSLKSIPGEEPIVMRRDYQANLNDGHQTPWKVSTEAPCKLPTSTREHILRNSSSMKDNLRKESFQKNAGLAKDSNKRRFWPKSSSFSINRNRHSSSSTASFSSNILETVSEKLSPVSSTESFFSAVAFPSRQPFWKGSRGRKSVSVPLPQLSGNAVKVASFALMENREHKKTSYCDACPVKDAKRVPCTFQIISETKDESVQNGIPRFGLKGQGHSERSGTRTYDRQDRKAGFPSNHIPPSFAFQLEKGPMPSASSQAAEGHSWTNSGSQMMQAPVSHAAEDKTNAFHAVPVNHSVAALKSFEKKSERTTCRLSLTSDLSNDTDQQNLSFVDHDGCSVRSDVKPHSCLTPDCRSPSVCANSYGSDPVSLDCHSSKGSTTFLSRMKNVVVQSLGAIFTMLVPGFSGQLESQEVDPNSDKDSGCSVNTDLDHVALQRSPSELSELQKLATLANRIAADKNRSRSSFDEDGLDRRTSSGEIPAMTTRCEFRSTQDVKGHHGHHSNANVHFSQETFGLVNKRNTICFLNEDPKSSAQVDRSFVSGSQFFELPHKSFHKGGTSFSNEPFGNSIKVLGDCGEMISDGVKDSGAKPFGHHCNSSFEASVLSPRRDSSKSGSSKVVNTGLASDSSRLDSFSRYGSVYDNLNTFGTDDVKGLLKKDDVLGCSAYFSNVETRERDAGESREPEKPYGCPRLNQNLPCSETIQVVAGSENFRRSHRMTSTMPKPCSSSEAWISRLNSSNREIWKQKCHTSFDDESEGSCLPSFSVSPELDQVIKMLTTSSCRETVGPIEEGLTSSRLLRPSSFRGSEVAAESLAVDQEQNVRHNSWTMQKQGFLHSSQNSTRDSAAQGGKLGLPSFTRADI